MKVYRLLIAFILFYPFVNDAYGIENVELSIVIRASHQDEIQLFFKVGKDDYSRKNSVVHVLSKPGAIDTLFFTFPYETNEEFRIDFGKKQGVKFEIFQIKLANMNNNVIWQSDSIASDYFFNSYIIEKSIINGVVSLKTLAHNNKFDPAMVLNLNGINRIQYHLYKNSNIVKSEFGITLKSSTGNIQNLRYFTRRFGREKYFPIVNHIQFWSSANEQRKIYLSIYSIDYILGIYFDLGQKSNNYTEIVDATFKDRFRFIEWKAADVFEDFFFGDSVIPNFSNNLLSLSLDANLDSHSNDKVFYYFNQNVLQRKMRSFIIKVSDQRILVDGIFVSIILISAFLFFANRKFIEKLGQKYNVS